MRHYMNTREPIAVCECGAQCHDKKDLNRFRKRHPALCTVRKKQEIEKREFAKQLAKGRSIDKELLAEAFRSVAITPETKETIRDYLKKISNV